MHAGVISIEDYREQFRTWLSDSPAAETFAREGARTDSQALRDWQRQLYEGDWIAVQWPVEIGGQGLSSLHQTCVWEEIAYARLPQPPGYIGLEVVGGTLARHGTPEQRERFVARLLSGQDIWCQGFSEPEAGSDLASLRTTARLEGDVFVVSGQKVWTTSAHEAEWCAALVRTGPPDSRHRGISYLAIEMSSPGLTIRPTETLTGDTEFSEVFFDDVVVPRENLIGELDGGWKLAMDTLANERGGYLLRRRAELEVMFEDIVTGVHAIVAEGGAVDVAALGWCRVLLDTLAGQARKTGRRMVDQPGMPSPLDSADKLLLTRTEQALTRFAYDTLGFGRVPGHGDEGLDASLSWQGHYLYGRACSIYSGTSQIQRSIIAERVLGLPRSR